MIEKIRPVATRLRQDCLCLEEQTRALMRHSAFNSLCKSDNPDEPSWVPNKELFVGQHGEMKAQIMLAVRHLEDARTRLGKLCQYSAGLEGRSIDP